LLALDEVTSICPVPLPYWLADAGGQGVQVWAAFHGFAQLEARWKAAGAQAVMDTTNVKVLMPGLADTKTLERASTLAGQAAYREHGEERHSRHPVMTEDMIRMLPAGWALLLRGNHRPVIVRLARGWEHRPYRRARRNGTAIAALVPPGRAALAALPDDISDLAAVLDAAPDAPEPVARLRSVGQAADGCELADVLAMPDRHAYPWDGGAA
jgi:hypothetical protein